MNNSYNSNNSGEEGNTGTSSPPNRRYRSACFTLNNWTEEIYNSITQELSQRAKGFVIGKEVGESGTPHLQGYVEFKAQVYFTTLKKLAPTAHWEKAKGNREQNIKYCTKDGDFVCTFPLPRRERLLQSYSQVTWKPWQQQVIDIIESPRDDRTINWFWEPTGNVGKSFLAKYLVLKYDAIIADGKKDNVFAQTLKWIENHNEQDPILILLDIPRYNKEYINYGVLESLKNGMIYSGKYEGGIACFESPHVIVFSNSRPDTDKLSYDRWNIVEI